jgi:hypothetical protein
MGLCYRSGVFAFVFLFLYFCWIAHLGIRMIDTKIPLPFFCFSSLSFACKREESTLRVRFHNYYSWSFSTGELATG